MKKYIIISDGGYTQDPNGLEVENLQILDIIDADSEEEAIAKFKEDPYYLDWKSTNLACSEMASKITFNNQ